MDGLKNFRNGGGFNDNTLFDFTTNAAVEAGHLSIDDDNGSGNDLSAKDGVEVSGFTTWHDETVAYLNNASNSGISVVMWSWCNPGGHDHQKYIDDLEHLITAYPAITFVFMTGHPNGDGESASDTSAYHAHVLIKAHAEAHNRWMIDYWDIETHDMNDVYYPGANDNGVDGANQFYATWQTNHPGDWFTNSCAHTTAVQI
jgi:hypothetical protein